MSSGDVRDPADAGAGQAPAAGAAAVPAEPVAGEQDAPAAAGREGGTRHGRTANMLPGRERRRFGLERFLVRLIATCGVVGIGVALGAILADNKVQGWIIGLVIALVSVVLSAILWSSRQV